MSITSRVQELRQHVEQISLDCGRDPKDIRLIAVSKRASAEQVLEAYGAGIRNFAENRVDVALGKMQDLPSDICWHFIGHLQSNKVEKAVSHFPWIHSVDSLSLLEKLASKEKHTKILLQVNVSGEGTKQGFSSYDVLAAWEKISLLPGIQVQGLMTMAPFTEDRQKVRECFSSLRKLRDQIREQAQNGPILPHLSMGMSHDYPIAIEEGATMLRIGSKIFLL